MKMKITSRRVFPVLLVCSTTVYAYTNTSPIADTPRNARGNQSVSILNEAEATERDNGYQTTLGYEASLGWTDNVDYAGTNQESATYLSLKPYAGVSKLYKDHRFWLNIKTSSGIVETGKNDEFVDYTAQFAGRLNDQGRHRLEFDARYDRGHDVFSFDRNPSGFTGQENLDVYEQPSLSARYTFGRPTARVRVGVWGEVREREYQNNRFATASYDHDGLQYGLQGWLQSTEKLSFLAGISNEEIEYKDSAAATKDSESVSYYVGVRWQATAKTAGEIRVGARNTDFDKLADSDRDRLYWHASIDWRPRQFDTFEFYTSRSTDVSRYDDFVDIENTRHGVRWVHEWDKQIKTRLGVDYLETDFVGPTASRSDDSMRYVAGIYGPIGPKTTMGLGYVWRERESSDANYDYDRNHVELTIRSYF